MYNNIVGDGWKEEHEKENIINIISFIYFRIND
jgi:hypothetical protein